VHGLKVALCFAALLIHGAIMPEPRRRDRAYFA
jgi:hypothetical protein